jgi:hypothetical protein
MLFFHDLITLSIFFLQVTACCVVIESSAKTSGTMKDVIPVETSSMSVTVVLAWRWRIEKKSCSSHGKGPTKVCPVIEGLDTIEGLGALKASNYGPHKRKWKKSWWHKIVWRGRTQKIWQSLNMSRDPPTTNYCTHFDACQIVLIVEYNIIDEMISSLHNWSSMFEVCFWVEALVNVQDVQQLATKFAGISVTRAQPNILLTEPTQGLNHGISLVQEVKPKSKPKNKLLKIGLGFSSKNIFIF